MIRTSVDLSVARYEVARAKVKLRAKREVAVVETARTMAVEIAKTWSQYLIILEGGLALGTVD